MFHRDLPHHAGWGILNCSDESLVEAALEHDVRVLKALPGNKIELVFAVRAQLPLVVFVGQNSQRFRRDLQLLDVRVVPAPYVRMPWCFTVLISLRERDTGIADD